MRSVSEAPPEPPEGRACATHDAPRKRVAGHQRAHAARQLDTRERRVLALAAQRRRRRPATLADRRCTESATPPRQAARARAERPERLPSTAHRALVTAASVARSDRPAAAPHLQRQAAAAVRGRWRPARFRRKAAFLASASTGVWSRHSASMVPSASAGADRVAVALLAQRRRQAHRGVEVADVDIGQVQVVDADIAAHRQPLGLGARARARRPPRCDRRHRCTRAPVSRTSSKIVSQRDRLGDHRHADRPSRVASGPLAATPSPSQASCGRSQTV